MKKVIFFSMLCNYYKISQPSEFIFQFTKVHHKTHAVIQFGVSMCAVSSNVLLANKGEQS